MLTRALFLSAGWLTLSFAVTLLRATKIQRISQIRSLLWLILVLLCGDLWALLTFGVIPEIVGLTISTFGIGWWWIRRLRHWNGLGQTLWVTSLVVSVLYIAYSFGVTAFTPLNSVAFVIAFCLTVMELLALALAMTYAYESLDVCCRPSWRHEYHPLPGPPSYVPKVSLHVPAYNEPTDVVQATLRSLAQLNYPNYEVLVVDNNTPQESTWRGLEKACAELGPRFHFLHLDQWPGYKSGALNFALTQTAPDTEIIGIIDADYLVQPEFLADLTPFFIDPQVAFVQTPQDYRDYTGNPYLAACHDGYRYFFAVSMPSRNEHNAIIFAGTMGLIRKSALQEIGGWDEWCITEDAEASLRVLKRGYQAIYVNQSYGTGLMPYTFDGLKRQRFRWCFGGIQILKKHWEALMPWAHWLNPENHLTLAQRYYYLVGGLQWFNEPLNLLFTIFLILGALLHLSPIGGVIRPLTGPLIIMPLLFLGMGMLRFLWVLRYTLQLSTRDAIRAMTNFFSLGWTVTLACIQGAIQSQGVFMRTPKSRSKSGIVRALRATQWETSIGLICIVSAVLVNVILPQTSTFFLGILLVWQASLYLAAPYYSLFSIRGEETPLQVNLQRPTVQESWIALWIVAIILGILSGVVVSQLLPGPAIDPAYVRFQPQDVPVQGLMGLPSDPQHKVSGKAASPTLAPSQTLKPTYPTVSATTDAASTTTSHVPTATQSAMTGVAPNTSNPR